MAYQHCAYALMHGPCVWAAVGRINLTLPDDLERRVRVAIAERGGKKGGIQEATVEAFELWLQKGTRKT